MNIFIIFRSEGGATPTPSGTFQTREQAEAYLDGEEKKLRASGKVVSRHNGILFWPSSSTFQGGVLKITPVTLTQSP